MKVYLLSALGYSVYEQESPAEVLTVGYFSPESLRTLSMLQNSPVLHLAYSVISGPLYLHDSGILVLAISLDSPFSHVSWE